MVTYRGGMVVEKGMYWNPTDGHRVDLRESGMLPNDESKSYLKISPAGLLVLAPLFGIMYVTFLPLFGIGVFLITWLVPVLGILGTFALTGVRVCSRVAGNSMAFNRKSSLLPAKYASLVRRASSKVTAAPHTDDATKILLVDDEVAYVEIPAQRLKVRGLNTDGAYNGEQAVSLADGGEPDNMVLDLRISGVDGIDEVLRKVMQNHPELHVIARSDKERVKDLKEPRNISVVDFLGKAMGIDVLVAD
ncbi:MAG: response regulator [Dissulfurispiraceae bacterium]